MGHHRLKAAAGASPADPYFSSTSLLLLGNGTNGGQNNTFLDSSTNNFTVERYGNVTQGSFSPFSAPDGRWSNYFDGSGDYLSVASASAIDISTGDWTIECWCYATTKTNLVDGVCGYGSYGAMMLYYSGTNWVLEIGNGSSVVVTISGAATTNTWQHLAVTRNGNTFTLWINGTSAGTGTSSATLAGSSRTVHIGYNGSSTQYFTGNISNFRLLKGTALYTAAFTPSTSPLTAITNTSLLTCQSNRFKDNSSNAFAITPSGNAAVTSFSPFTPLAEYSAGSNGGSGYFDGVVDYLSIPANTIFDFNADFTVDGWAYPTDFNFNGYAYTFRQLFGKHSVNSYYSSAILATINSDGIGFGLYSGGASGGGAGSPVGYVLPINAWHHFALTKSGTSLAVYINGVRVGTGTSSGPINNPSETPVCLGQIMKTYGGPNYDAPFQSYKGYMYNIRYVKGSALYSGTTYTIPTAPTTAVSGTTLLLNFTNASIIDSTAKNNLETVGDAQISTSVKKFGTGSLKFDGTGDYLSLPSNSNLSFGTGDFTIECWAYVLGTSSGGSNNDYGSFADFRTANTSQVNVLWCFLAGSAPIFFVNGSSIITGSNMTLNTWTHLALCRSSGVTKMFMGGTQVGSSYTDANNYTSTVARIGGNISGDSFLYAYLDDYRISKTARYTSNFTPPSAQLPAR